MASAAFRTNCLHDFLDAIGIGFGSQSGLGCFGSSAEIAGKFGQIGFVVPDGVGSHGFGAFEGAGIFGKYFRDHARQHFDALKGGFGSFSIERSATSHATNSGIVERQQFENGLTGTNVGSSLFFWSQWSSSHRAERDKGAEYYGSGKGNAFHHKFPLEKDPVGRFWQQPVRRIVPRC